MIRKVTQAEINKAFGHVDVAPSPSALTGGSGKPLITNGPIVYRFDFETVLVADLQNSKKLWQLEAKQRQGWELLSAAPKGSDAMLLTWRRPFSS